MLLASLCSTFQLLFYEASAFLLLLASTPLVLGAQLYLSLWVVVLSGSCSCHHRLLHQHLALLWQPIYLQPGEYQELSLHTGMLVHLGPQFEQSSHLEYHICLEPQLRV